MNTSKNTSSKKNKSLLLIIIALSLGLIGTILWGVKSSSTLKSNERAFATEKQLKIEELKTVEEEYQILLTENNVNKEEVILAKERLQQLIDSVKNIKPDYTLINKLRSVRDELKVKLKKIIAENELLKEKNILLASEKDSISSELTKTLVVYDSVNYANKKLALVVTKAQKLFITKLENKSVYIKKSGKTVKTSKAKKTSGIEACFTVSPNTITESGDKKFYIQLVSPTKKVIGSRFYLTNENDQIIKFSKIANFRYSNKEMRICDFVEPLVNEVFEKGRYTINIFDGTHLISSSSLSLK